MMIWTDGRIIDAKELRVGVEDRVFEHGIGLFETFRTWDGNAPLLSRHLARLRASATSLGIPLEGVVLPDAVAVRSLLEATGTGPDARVRITLTGGTSASGGATLWMRSAAFTAVPAPAESAIDFGSWEVWAADPLARHKSLNYWSRRLAFEAAIKRDLIDILSSTDGARIWEGSRTNLFAMHDGILHTPSLDGPIVPGISRELTIEAGRQLGLIVQQPRGFTIPFMAGCTEVFLTNSVRGIIPVSRFREITWPIPGETTIALQTALNQRIETAVRERIDL